MRSSRDEVSPAASPLNLYYSNRCHVSFKHQPPYRKTLDALYERAEFTHWPHDATRRVDRNVALSATGRLSRRPQAENLLDPTSLSLSGTGAQFSADYTGKVVEIPIPSGVIRFIDLETVERAVSIHGNGWVQDEGGNVYKLSLAIGQTPSGNLRSTFSVTARK